MSRGIGAAQRRVLDALIQRGDNDSYQITPAITYFVGETVTKARARWRWYTIDLLDLATTDSPRSLRSGLHRAIHGLHERGMVDISSEIPYPQPFGGYFDEYAYLVGRVNLFELSDLDPRWPHGPERSLWFRLPPPTRYDAAGGVRPPPDDDQLSILNVMLSIYDEIQDGYDYWSFQDFIHARDRSQKWASTIGQFVKWLFCG